MAMVRSALDPIGVVAVAPLFEESGSAVALETVAMFWTVGPALSSTCSTRLKVAVAPARSVVRVHVTPEVVVQLNAGPEVWVNDTKVVPAGRGSLSETSTASEGPPFATAMV